jgi:hypothetical protein
MQIHINPAFSDVFLFTRGFLKGVPLVFRSGLLVRFHISRRYLLYAHNENVISDYISCLLLLQYQ